ncbi:hypothetical protein LPE509_01095 [Legionella pneumophila subsp. pneumophila LPE509]|nr:hypothetical protein LPE509_01095 [Legionella pneumophila subsp. pneumophila LPE509]
MPSVIIINESDGLFVVWCYVLFQNRKAELTIRQVDWL